MEELVRTVILPRLDQLEAEVKFLRDVTWPVCQGLRETGSPFQDIQGKRKFFRHLYEDEAIDLLKKKAEFTGITNQVLMDKELDLIRGGGGLKDKNQ
jgi:hypothetical protein